MSNRPDFKLERPFAELGDKTIIPNRSTVSGRADLENGFPLITQQPVAQGGVPPSRTDFNGILFQLSQYCMYYQSGGMWEWDEAVDYAVPAIVYHNGIFYRCQKASGPKLETVVPPGSDTEYWTDIIPDLTDNWSEVYSAIERASELFESTQLTVISADMSGQFIVRGDRRALFPSGSIIKIGYFRYTVGDTAYTAGENYTTVDVDAPVLTSLVGEVVTKKVPYISHPPIPDGRELAVVPENGFTSLTPPNATDNFRIVSPKYAVALINYMLREAGSLIGGVKYETTNLTVASVTGDGQSKITINSTLETVVAAIHVGDYLQLVKGSDKVIVCVYDISLQSGTPLLMLDKSIASTYVGATILKGVKSDDEGIIVTPGQKVQRITVTVTPESIASDETATATAAIYPPDAENQTVEWSLLNDDIASIDSSSGVITPLSEGSVGNVSVIATATDGSAVTGSGSVEIYKAGLSYSDPIGIVDTGARTQNGAVLAYIDEDFNIIEQLPDDWNWDEHPAFNFERVVDDNGDYYQRIPLAYRKRGKVPAGKPYAGNYYELLCTTAKPGFSPSPAFMKAGQVVDHFDIATYRACRVGNKAGSRPSTTPWVNVTHPIAVSACAAAGDGCHMLSIQEHQEICFRAVVEKKTFELRNFSGYRGISAFLNGAGSVYIEYLQGMRTNAFGELEIWDKNGNMTYVNTGKIPNANGYISSLLDGEYFDSLFIPDSTTRDIASSMIPDSPNMKPEESRVCDVHLYFSNVESGGFSTQLIFTASHQSNAVAFRMAKI